MIQLPLNIQNSEQSNELGTLKSDPLTGFGVQLHYLKVC